MIFLGRIVYFFEKDHQKKQPSAAFLLLDF